VVLHDSPVSVPGKKGLRKKGKYDENIVITSAMKQHIKSKSTKKFLWVLMVQYIAYWVQF
jgi:hypothetical protein